MNVAKRSTNIVNVSTRYQKNNAILTTTTTCRSSQVSGAVRGLVERLEEKVDMSLDIRSVFIPKILGFDFLIDAKTNKLRLIEVNATPGLVAREKSGAEWGVKRRVLEESWGISGGQEGNFVTVSF